MTARSVFAVDRGIFDHPMFAPEPYTEREAWLWLVSEAAWKPRRIRVRNGTIELARGQLAHATRFMASKWLWSEARVRRFLKRLKTDAMIDAQPDAHATLITICKYNEYQRVSLPSDAHADADNDAHATRTRRKEEDREYTEQDSVAEATAEPRSAETLDPKTILFRKGLPAIGELTGRKPETLRSVLGRWMKLTGDDAGAILAEIERCRGSPVADPVAWIEARLKPREPNGKPRRVSTAEQAAAAMAGALERLGGQQQRERDADASRGDDGGPAAGGGNTAPRSLSANPHGYGTA